MFVNTNYRIIKKKVTFDTHWWLTHKKSINRIKAIKYG